MRAVAKRAVEQTGARGGEVLAFDRLRGTDRTAARLVALVAESRGVPAILLLHPSRCEAAVAAARQLAMYLMHVSLRRNYADVGAYFGRDRTTVAYACSHVEDRRDEPAFDAEVTRLEEQLDIDAAAGKTREADRARA